MNCPIDNTPLAIAERQGIEIDYCPKCRGVWLDRGELDKLIERNAQYNARPDANEEYEIAPHDDYRNERSPYQQGQPDHQSAQPQTSSGPDIASIVGDLINKGLEKKLQQRQYSGKNKKKKGGLLGELFDF